MEKEVRLQPKVSQDVCDKLTKEAKENGHTKVGPYVAHLLTKHVSKNESPKHQPKNETK